MPGQIQQLTQSTDSLATDWHNCPAGAADNRWYCCYQDENFGSRGLQWHFEHRNDRIYFNNYGFQNQTSGWVDTGVLTIRPNGRPFLGPYRELWTEPPYAMASYVGDYTNDRAEDFTACK
ncbi:hypothetical protein [Kitasatospora sp. NPDC057541]|uniref:hypothetical protein n=1 Tax=Kitasatospora sp. NPDC057541 TaxID=3346161 RepID=UPI0036AA9405